MPPEQKSISMTKDIVTRFSKARELVMDSLAGMFTFGKAYLMLPQH